MDLSETAVVGMDSDHMKAMWAGQSNILVAVRVRPILKQDSNKKSCARVLDEKVVIVLDPAAGDKQDVLRANRSKEKQYAFDYACDFKSSQEMVYQRTAKFLVHGVLDGFNATVFAYGQTCSGKTHTMIGSSDDPGIMVRIMNDLYIHAAASGKKLAMQYRVTVSFLEVYNENIRDLLSDVVEYLDLREDPIKGPIVAGVTEVEAKSGSEVMNLLHQGNARRSQAATAANEVSSRSHAVLQVVVECKDRAPGTVANIKVGKLSLIDLAGSERAANTKNSGARLVEGANINRSLLALGNCINALGEKGNKGNFVPYRDSKLTRLLKDSLGGNCRTVMIANVNPSSSSFEETLNTLKYANRAKNIKTSVQRNVLNVNYHISEYVSLISNLRSEIKLLKEQMDNGKGQAKDDFAPPLSVDVRGSVDHPPMHPSSRVGGPQSPNSKNNMPSTPLLALRESLKSNGFAGINPANGGAGGFGNATLGQDRELVNGMRQNIVDNFQERMQLRRSLIELEDQNVQNSIEIGKRQLIVVQWSHHRGYGGVNSEGGPDAPLFTNKSDFTADLLENGSNEVKEAWVECEQLRKACVKNNGMKRNIAKRLRHNEKEAEKFREELTTKITGEERKELMELQYQVGRLELENMELEQHRIVHESVLKGKDLTIQKLKLQLAVRDKLIQRQQQVLSHHDLEEEVGYKQLALMEESLLSDPFSMNHTMGTSVPPPSPPRELVPFQQKQIALEGGIASTSEHGPRAGSAATFQAQNPHQFNNQGIGHGHHHSIPPLDVHQAKFNPHNRNQPRHGLGKHEMRPLSHESNRNPSNPHDSFDFDISEPPITERQGHSSGREKQEDGFYLEDSMDSQHSQNHQNQHRHRGNGKYVAKLEPLSTAISTISKDEEEDETNITNNSSGVNLSYSVLSENRSKECLIHPEPMQQQNYQFQPEKPRTPRTPNGGRSNGSNSNHGSNDRGERDHAGGRNKRPSQNQNNSLDEGMVGVEGRGYGNGGGYQGRGGNGHGRNNQSNNNNDIDEPSYSNGSNHYSDNEYEGMVGVEGRGYGNGGGFNGGVGGRQSKSKHQNKNVILNKLRKQVNNDNISGNMDNNQGLSVGGAAVGNGNRRPR